MKLLTKEEEDAHYRAVLKGGSIGTVLGLIGGYAGVMAASRRYHTIRNLTLPMKAFLVTSSGTFVGIIAADNSSRNFEAERNADQQWYQNREQRLREESLQGMSFMERSLAWARKEKYTIVTATWVASMIGSFVLVGRNPYLSGQQKIVQARVYAQGLTLAVLVASAAFEISDQKKGKGILKKKLEEQEAAGKGQVIAEEPVRQHQQQNEGEGDLWKDMVAAEEERLKKKHQSVWEHPELHKEGQQQQQHAKEVKEVKEEKKEQQ
ncbi:hypothetical protein BDV38DRAFT_288517 [Aspergillus pseudotamarii]|uniref:HIG1 domain-containing protein n=1 Tax=Aspergillus pseudotamarii TaxID=132259 RepID=A0A5N6SAN1_ASPPS|nr:uncharacterized protein BDV38DRAFT_288517 [Aspergillus pseudotamarii]KAE8131645.1 hypothetical protein BDV38DRAFT_288517 [Aspergillus pseudotamarii]